MKTHNSRLARRFVARSNSCPQCEHGLALYGPNCHVCGRELLQRTKADLALMRPI